MQCTGVNRIMEATCVSVYNFSRMLKQTMGEEKNEDKDHAYRNYGSFNHVWIYLRFLTAHKHKSCTESRHESHACSDRGHITKKSGLCLICAVHTANKQPDQIRFVSLESAEKI